MSIPCPAGCVKLFLTPQGLRSHLSSAKSCRWYKSGRLADLGLDNTSDDLEITNSAREGGIETLPEEALMDTWDEAYDFYHFIPSTIPSTMDEQPAIGEAGPGPSTTSSRQQKRVLDDDDDKCYEENNITAGKVIRMNDDLHKRWHQLFKTSNGDGDVNMEDMTNDSEDTSQYAPFASLLDWRIAHWVVKDGIGHKSFDRFLAIPGVGYSTMSDNIYTAELLLD